jgi:hypothetical protein
VSSDNEVRVNVNEIQTHTVPTDAPDWVQYEACVGVYCKTCGAEAVGVKAHAAGFDYCRNCYHTGRAYSDLRSEQLDGFRAAMPGWKVSVEHTGGGCFWLAFYPPNGGGYFYAATAGEASLPSTNDEDDLPIRGGWGYVGRYFWNDEDDAASEEHPDYEGTMIYEAPGIDGDDFWKNYPAGTAGDDEIAVAIGNDWNRILRQRA